MPITIVVGPPCAGKSTHVRENAAPGDVIVDYDLIAEALGSSVPHGSTGAVRDAALAARNAVIQQVLKSASPSWIIHTRPRGELLRQYEEVGVKFVLIDPGKAECLRRADSGERPQETATVIHAWYDNPPEIPHAKGSEKMTDLTKKTLVSPAGADPLAYVMSDETVDRMGDVIEAKGWDLASFQKNPIALFGHDHNFVIGHWTDVKVVGRALVGKLNLLPKGISSRLDEIRAAVDAGILRAVSVGFAADAKMAEPNNTGGFLIRSAELLECSLVAVPANPSALQMAKSLNLTDSACGVIFRPAAAREEAGVSDTEIPQPSETAASGKPSRVVKLGDTARDRAPPFVVREIKRTA